mgnify:CR=1 FL=1
MSERSFAIGCVGLALAFGMVVPDPGRQPAAPSSPGIALSQPSARPAAEKTIDRMEGVPFAVHHAAPVKADATPALLWVVRNAP